MINWCKKHDNAPTVDNQRDCDLCWLFAKERERWPLWKLVVWNLIGRPYIRSQFHWLRR